MWTHNKPLKLTDRPCHVAGRASAAPRPPTAEADVKGTSVAVANRRRIGILGFGPGLNARPATWNAEVSPVAAALHQSLQRRIGGGILMVLNATSQCRADGGLFASAVVARDATSNPPLHQPARREARR
jgi:hypothetical protein